MTHLNILTEIGHTDRNGTGTILVVISAVTTSLYTIRIDEGSYTIDPIWETSDVVCPFPKVLHDSNHSWSLQVVSQQQDWHEADQFDWSSLPSLFAYSVPWMADNFHYRWYDSL